MDHKVLLLTVLARLANAIPAPGHGALLGYCDNNSQCGQDECCVSFNQPRGRRTVLDYLDPNLMQLVHGSCKILGTDGSKCFVNNLNTGVTGLYYNCTCTTGHTCEGTGMVEVPKGEAGITNLYGYVQLRKKVGRATGAACSSGADCADTECCVNHFQIEGKRGNITKRQYYGHCEPMGTDRSSCLVNGGSGKPDSVVFSCPCVTGLKCHGLGYFEVPLGERGTCGM